MEDETRGKNSGQAQVGGLGTSGENSAVTTVLPATVTTTDGPWTHFDGKRVFEPDQEQRVRQRLQQLATEEIPKLTTDEVQIKAEDAVNFLTAYRTRLTEHQAGYTYEVAPPKAVVSVDENGRTATATVEYTYWYPEPKTPVEQYRAQVMRAVQLVDYYRYHERVVEPVMKSFAHDRTE